MNKLKKKLKSQVGETIAEVLVALLVSAFALMMLAVMIRSAERSVKRSNEAMNAYYSSTAETGTSGAITVIFTYSEKTDGSSLEEKKTKTYSCDMKSNSKMLGGKNVLFYVKAPKSGGTP